MTVTDKTVEKQRGKPFRKGQSGNPNGRPKGARNATTLALETLLDGQATALTQKAIDLALTGDMAALRLCLDRIIPARKGSTRNIRSATDQQCPGGGSGLFRRACGRCQWRAYARRC